MKRFFSTGLIGVLLAASLFAQSQKDLNVFKHDIQAKLDSMQAAGLFPGATLGIVLKNGTELKFATGLADEEAEQAMPLEGRMFTGSAGKTFVSAVALQLVDEGELDLDALVSSYLGSLSWYSRLPNHDSLTVRMIMQHTGGLPRYVFKEAFTKALLENSDKVWKPEETLAYVFDDTPVHPPGRGWGYSDTDYIVLGVIIEKITGETLYKQAQRRLLDPLGLRDTSPSNHRKLKGLVTGYTGDKSPPFMLPGKVPVDGVYPINPQFEWCGGGFITTSLDMARWAKALYEGKVFSETMMEELLKAADWRTGQPAEAGYGLGVMIFNTPFGKIYGHGGIFPGYQTQMSYFPKWKTSVTIQVNADRLGPKLKADPNQLIGELIPVIQGLYTESL